MLNYANNETLAKDILLHKIYELKISESKKPHSKLHHLRNYIDSDSDGEYYKVPYKLFSNLMDDLEKKGLIKIIGESKTEMMSGEKAKDLDLLYDTVEQVKYIAFDFNIIASLPQIEKEIVHFLTHSKDEKIKVDLENKKNEDDKKEIKSILLVTPEHGKFDYLWVIINDDFSNKLKVSTKSKQNMNDDSFAMKLYELADAKEIKYDKGLWDDVNYALYKRKVFKNKFKKTTILTRHRDKLSVKDGYTVKKITLSRLSKEELAYFATK